MMKSKSKTKKVFVDKNNEKKQNIQNSKLNPNNMLRRFKSHNVYNTVRGTKLKNGQNTQKNSSNENKILTINLNLQNSDENLQKHNIINQNEYGNKYSSNSKEKDNFPKNKIKTEYTKSKSNQRFLTNKQIEKINLYINSGRRNKMDSIKILNEESIQELDTEDNFNYIENGNEMIKTEENTNINNPINPNENIYKNYYSEPQKNLNQNFEINYLLNIKYLSSSKKNDKDSLLECLNTKGIIINYQNENGWSALHFACDEGNLKIVEILLKAQIDVNLQTNEKKTALHFTASRGYFDISKLLVEKKANLNLCDNEKNLPVHLCSMTIHNELLNYLLEQNPSSALVKNLYGKTPLDLAINEENKEIIKKFLPGNNIKNIKINEGKNNNILNKHCNNNIMKEQCRRIKIHNTNSKQINSLMKTINQNGRKSIPKKVPVITKYLKPKTAEKTNNQNNNNININTNKYNKKINGNVIMVSTNYTNGNSINNTPHYNTTQGNFNYNSNNNSKVKKQPERVKVVLESPKKISNEIQNQNQLNKTRKSRYANNNNNVNNSNSNNNHTNKSNNKNLHNKDNLNLGKNKKNNNVNNNNINNLSNYNSTNTKKTISIFSSKISATSRKSANNYPDKISSVNNSNNNNNIHPNVNNINLNRNKELGKHRTISVPRFSNYHLNISNNNNVNYNNSNNINGIENSCVNKFERQEKRRKSLSDSRKNKIVKKNNNQKLNNFNIIENIEISLEFDGNEKLNSLKKVNSNNNLKITNNISTQTTTQTPNLNSDNNSNNNTNPNSQKNQPNINENNQNLNIQNQINILNNNSKTEKQQKPIISSIINLSSPKKNSNLSNEELKQKITNNQEINNKENNINLSQNTSNQILLNTSKTEIKDESNDSQNESYEEDNNTSSNNNSLSSESTEEKIGPSSFICIALLGRGSFGEVYLVEHKKTNEKYAMKVLDKNRIAEQNIFKYAMTERNVLSIVHNPFIVKLNYAFQTNDKLFLLLDYCPGGDLSEQLQLQTRFSEEKAKFYLCEVILALGELHKKDIIFRDLKPDNVVIDKEGHAMLTDFGLSREGVYDAKIAKSFCGSIAYLAPEMLSRTGHGKAVDWYLLGVLFYEMLVGIPPYFTNSKEQIFRNIEKADLKIPNFISNKAQKLIKALLKKDPNFRLGSKGDVDEIMKFEYFKDVDWNKVYNRELKPPKNIQDGRQIKMFKEPKLFADDEDDDDGDENGNDDNTKFEGWSFVHGNNQKLDNNNQSQIHSQSQMNNNNRSYNKKK